MQRHELERDYFFEFAGMPQSGKSTVEEIVAHFLKREGYLIGEYRGGSRYSPLYNAPIADLNLWLACKAAQFVLEAVEREKEPHKIFLLDRGLIDRSIFTETLLRRGEIDNLEAARTISAFLTLPQLLKHIGGVFIFKTSPEIALRRESKNKLRPSPGGVMNIGFLTDMQLAVQDGFERITARLSNTHVELINTEEDDGQELKVAGQIVETILGIVHNPTR